MHEKRVILAEYFSTDDKTLLFIVRKDFDKPEIVEIKKSQNEIRQFITAHFSEQRKDNESGQVLMKISGQKNFRISLNHLFPLFYQNLHKATR
jgi:hypothetical protein